MSLPYQKSYIHFSYKFKLVNKELQNSLTHCQVTPLPRKLPTWAYSFPLVSRYCFNLRGPRLASSCLEKSKPSSMYPRLTSALILSFYK